MLRNGNGGLVSIARKMTACAVIALVAFGGCGEDEGQPQTIELVEGDIVVSFELLAHPDLPTAPTFAVWLENGGGEYIQTLYVTKWLSEFGHEEDYVCSKWQAAADWTNADSATVDAATSASPNIGELALMFDCEQLGIPPGSYRVQSQFGVYDEFSLFYTAEINLGEGTADAVVTLTPLPQEDQLAREAVDEYAVRYIDQ